MVVVKANLPQFLATLQGVAGITNLYETLAGRRRKELAWTRRGDEDGR
jgi:hypothetical protein